MRIQNKMVGTSIGVSIDLLVVGEFVGMIHEDGSQA